MWLFLASEAMFFGSLFSAYVSVARRRRELARQRGSILDGRLALLNTVLLLGLTAIVVVLVGAGKRSGRGIDASAPFRPGMLSLSSVGGIAVLLSCSQADRNTGAKIDAGLHPCDQYASCVLVHPHRCPRAARGGRRRAQRLARHSGSDACCRRSLMERLRAAQLYWLFVEPYGSPS